METETPPVVSRPFRLPLVAWIAWGLYAAVMLALLFLRKDAVSAYEIGRSFGQIVAMLIFPTLAAALAWRICRRSAAAGHAVFFAVLVLCVAGQLLQFTRRAEANAEMRRLAEEERNLQVEQRAALAQGHAIDSTKAAKLGELASTQLATMAANSSGHERLLAEAGKAYLDQLLAVKGHYDAAVKNLGMGDFWKLTTFDDPKVIAERRVAVRTFAQANARFAAMQDENGTGFRQELAVRGIPADEMEKAIADYRDGAGARLPLLAKIRASDAQLAQAMLDFLDFAETRRGKWQLDATSGKIIFADKETLDRYSEILQRVKTASAEQAAAQQQMLAEKG